MDFVMENTENHTNIGQYNSECRVVNYVVDDNNMFELTLLDYRNEGSGNFLLDEVINNALRKFLCGLTFPVDICQTFREIYDIVGNVYLICLSLKRRNLDGKITETDRISVVNGKVDFIFMTIDGAQVKLHDNRFWSYKSPYITACYEVGMLLSKVIVNDEAVIDASEEVNLQFMPTLDKVRELANSLLPSDKALFNTRKRVKDCDCGK